MWFRGWFEVDGDGLKVEHHRFPGVLQGLFLGIASAATAWQLRAIGRVAAGLRIMLDDYAESQC
jgi:hypothetical protein